MAKTQMFWWPSDCSWLPSSSWPRHSSKLWSSGWGWRGLGHRSSRRCSAQIGPCCCWSSTPFQSSQTALHRQKKRLDQSQTSHSSLHMGEHTKRANHWKTENQKCKTNRTDWPLKVIGKWLEPPFHSDQSVRVPQGTRRKSYILIC